VLHVEQTADNCVKCNVCNTVCPVSAVTDLFPGPKYEGPQGQRFRARVDLEGSPDHSLDYCSACGLCTQACPEGVLIAEINQVARSRLVAERGGLGLRDNIISRPSLMGLVARPVAPLANRVMASRPVRVAVEKAMGVHRDAAMPRFSAMTLRSWARSHRGPRGAARTVAYFHGCAAQEFEPEVGAAVMRVLERNGIAVSLPRQGCCGLPLISNGDFPAARRTAGRLVSRLRRAADDPGTIVASSTSCGMTLKAKYRELLGLDDEASRAVGLAVWDICEYLVALDDEVGLDRSLAPLPARAVYHPPCQLMAHGVGTPALDLLALVPELEVERSRAGCCGTAGTYGVKVEKYQIAMDVGRSLFDQVAETRPDFVVCDSETCRWHIARVTGLPVYHPVQVLDHAYAAARPPRDGWTARWRGTTPSWRSR
jgi:glycerol-3-phosphate dehydrogenase subunit C